MITDRLTARILGVVLLTVPLIIAISSLAFAKPELRAQPVFVAFVFAPALGLMIAGGRLLQRARFLKD